MKFCLLALLLTLVGCTSDTSDGYVSIFNGKNLDGWTYMKTKHYNEEVGYIVQNGEMITNGKCGNLYTNERYKNYSFRFEFKFTEGKLGNSGLGMRTEMDASYPSGTNFELQILDNSNPKYAKLKPYQYHGSVYGKVPAKRGFLKPRGEWNTQEVTVIGDHVKITLNGTVILNADLSKYPEKLRKKEGHLLLAGHNDGVSFRNLRIKELP